MTNIKPGDTVRISLIPPGPAGQRIAGQLDVIVLGSEADYITGEFDALISPAMDMEDVAMALDACDVALSDLQVGPVYILRNVQVDDVAENFGNPAGR